MNEIAFIKKLGAIAKREPAPEVRVSSAVIAAINAEAYDDDRTWVWMASLSAAAALLIVIPAYQALEILIDPLQGFVGHFTWILT
jgi:hypothetical protein